MSKINKGRILVVVAHPDDEILGCGATLARHIKRGDRAAVVFMADGVTSRYYNPEQKLSRTKELSRARKDILRRRKEAIKAAAILGIREKDLFFMNLADQRLDMYLLLDLIKRIEMIKNSFLPGKVFTHFWNDLNLDHQIVCRAVLTAFRPVVGRSRVPVYQMEIPETTRFSVPYQGADFLPDQFVDAHSTLALKIRAFKAYESEKQAAPHPRSEEYIRSLAYQRGREAGFKAAEAFQTSFATDRERLARRLK